MLLTAPVGGSRLRGVGSALPGRTLTAADLAAPFGKTGDWITARTGIEQLRRADSVAELCSLADDAARRALADAGLDETDIDLVVTTSCSIEQEPGTPTAIARGVAAGAARMHLNSACSGFCYALAVADSLIRSGAATLVLVVAAEFMSGLVDPEDLGTSIVFGDGAGAVVVGASAAPSAVGPVVWGSDGGQSGAIDCGPVRGGRLRMAGQQVFRWAVQTVPRLAEDACRRAGVTPEQIEVFAPHQANLRITDAVVARLGMTCAVIADSVRTTGNTSAASVPIALDDLRRRGRSRSGALALLTGFGAGLSYAAQVVVLP